MKVFVAAVASVTDYRKEQSLYIDHTSVHMTKDGAIEAIMTALLKENPQWWLDFPLDLKVVLDRKLTKDQLMRLQIYLKEEEIDEWCQDDVPEDEEEFNQFKKAELVTLEQQKQQVHAFVRNSNKFPFTNLKVPKLPAGEYVGEPWTWSIRKTEIENVWEDDEAEGKKRSRS